MSTDLTRLMNALLAPAGQSLEATSWSPPVDVYRVPSGWLLKFDLAGLRSSDIQVTAHGRQLAVRGRRRDWVIEESHGCSAYSMEIAYSHFERIIELPCDVEQMQIATEYRDGMLLIRLDTEGCRE